VIIKLKPQHYETFYHFHPQSWSPLTKHCYSIQFPKMDGVSSSVLSYPTIETTSPFICFLCSVCRGWNPGPLAIALSPSYISRSMSKSCKIWDVISQGWASKSSSFPHHAEFSLVANRTQIPPSTSYVIPGVRQKPPLLRNPKVWLLCECRPSYHTPPRKACVYNQNYKLHWSQICYISKRCLII
jgi:hypothetical protein